MLSQSEILTTIKQQIHEEIPDAKVYLFGSRATGNLNDESDWDILIKTSMNVNRALRKKIYYKLFPLTLQILNTIDCTIVNEKDWQENPSYYVLKHSITNEAVQV